jgi:hypothetical protein
VARRTRLIVKRVARTLRRGLPVDAPLRITFSNRFDKGVDGYCFNYYRAHLPGRSERCEIRIRAGMCATRTIEVLVHEYAHALAFPHQDHGARWGVCYSRAYRVASGDR